MLEQTIRTYITEKIPTGLITIHIKDQSLHIGLQGKEKGWAARGKFDLCNPHLFDNIDQWIAHLFILERVAKK